MLSGKILKRILVGLFIITLAVAGLAVTVVPAAAVTVEGICELGLGGDWMGSTPNEDGGLCININDFKPVNKFCFVIDPTATEVTLQWDAGAGTWIFFQCGYYSLPVASVPAFIPMKRQGVCKLTSITEIAFMGGYVTATVKGAPSVLKLKANGKTYSLPVVPGSVVANGDGTYTAQFYTIDPVTGQALVPAGEYTARCHGTNGSKDGGSSNSVSISY